MWTLLVVLTIPWKVFSQIDIKASAIPIPIPQAILPLNGMREPVLPTLATPYVQLDHLQPFETILL